jgi:hypothetical protein
MKRRLWLLNLILIALLAVIAVRFQQVRQETLERAAQNLNQAVKPEQMPPLPAVAAPAPLAAVNYADVAIRMLFSRDRNPAVILDPVVPPPEKPMPPLPVAYGAMFFGEPSIILSLPNAKASQRIYRKGEVIGEFKLVSFDAQQIVFEWDGKTIERRLDQIMAKPSDAPQEIAASTAKPATTTVAPATTSSTGPGAANGDGNRACVAGDTSPAGAVVDGYRKLETTTAFGRACRWEPVK